ncbi:magnesium/cobalt transporter CorA [Paenibacillus mesophilus]|uniref:magnesium/cobalt transporter CorA n=1 Tax=Paenibacillus mesophilus TaxID=2582849 RepID=UPI00110E1C36|nr:magnesium/cobalt transporter CorA [Paenibacillus mesophilus]TMV46822.1 magnesium/cobalt transporter CorA [Paenibacillus mesophilus]
MLRIFAVTRQLTPIPDITLDQLNGPDVMWYWVDFNAPTEEEARNLEQHFHFHPLAIEDCFHLLQRPKLDHYENVHFFVLHALDQTNLSAQEVDLFVGSHFLVTFHHKELKELDDAWLRITTQNNVWGRGPLYAMYAVMDNLVDEYFPAVYQIEDQLLEIETGGGRNMSPTLMNDVFEIRSKLLKLRKTIFPMRDLLYRVVSSDRVEGLKEQLVYYTDIYDHLLKLSELIDANREMTADLRDNYISLSSNRMNTIMKTLTVITTIFMPLTFIAGIYGMNFNFMPELQWHWGYFAVLGTMFMIGFGMYAWFRKKGWFD